MIVLVDIDVPCILVPRKDERDLALDEKEDFFSSVIFVEDVLVFGEKLWLKDRTEPQNEAQIPVHEEIDFLVALFIDIEGQLRPELCWELLNEVVQFIHIFLEFIA